MSSDVSELPEDIDLGRRVAELEREVASLNGRMHDLKEKLVTAAKVARNELTETDDERVIVENMNGKYVQDSVMFSLLLRGQQTREQMKKTLEGWGIPYGSWFSGGNMRNRLINIHLIKVDGKNDNGEEIYSLSVRGNTVTREKLENLKKKKSA